MPSENERNESTERKLLRRSYLILKVFTRNRAGLLRDIEMCLGEERCKWRIEDMRNPVDMKTLMGYWKNVTKKKEEW